jgi:hypothetical protein
MCMHVYRNTQHASAVKVPKRPRDKQTVHQSFGAANTKIRMYKCHLHGHEYARARISALRHTSTNVTDEVRRHQVNVDRGQAA